MPRNSRLPELDYPPVQAYRFASAAFSAGIDTTAVDGTKIQVYSAEKTLADCFKFRNKIGQDVRLEALHSAEAKEYVHQQTVVKPKGIHVGEPGFKPKF